MYLKQWLKEKASFEDHNLKALREKILKDNLFPSVGNFYTCRAYLVGKGSDRYTGHDLKLLEEMYAEYYNSECKRKSNKDNKIVDVV